MGIQVGWTRKWPERSDGMKALFLIPARGGSKGLPGKNLALVGGVPLVGRAVRVGRQVARGLPGSRVVCSTDDPAIANAAREWGADVPFVRPNSLASDGARSLDVVRHALEALGEDFDAVVLLQPTSPLTEREDVLGSLHLFQMTGEPVVSVCCAEHPVEWYKRMDRAGRLAPVLPNFSADLRQKVERACRPNGAVFVASPAQVSGKGFWTAETRGYVMPVERSVDVDTVADLGVARALLTARQVSAVKIAAREVGPGHPCFVIAEAGVNHNGHLDLALKLVDAAADAGADAVKFQTFSAERLTTVRAAKAAYQVANTGSRGSQFEMLKALELSPQAHATLLTRSRERGILFLSSAFDEESSNFLDDLGVAAFKVPSGELTNLPFLRHLARKGRPLVVSTGMATLGETAAAVDAVRAEGCKELVLLHCVSDYPADPADANLRAMASLREAFGAPTGFSDHTAGDVVTLAAVALGACLVEKHFTLDRTMPGPDHRASVEPAELAALVRRIRTVESALGSGVKMPAASESPVARVARKSLVASCFISAGVPLGPEMVALKRPGTGLAPEAIVGLLGKRAVREIPEGALLETRMFE